MWYQDRVEVPGEVIYKIVTSEEKLGFSVAMALITKSEPHSHNECLESYVLLSGRLTVHLDSERTILDESGCVLHIPKGTVHSAESLDDTPARVLVISIPAWTKEDHHTVS